MKKSAQDRDMILGHGWSLARKEKVLLPSAGPSRDPGKPHLHLQLVPLCSPQTKQLYVASW